MELDKNGKIYKNLKDVEDVKTIYGPETTGALGRVISYWDKGYSTEVEGIESCFNLEIKEFFGAKIGFMIPRFSIIYSGFINNYEQVDELYVNRSTEDDEAFVRSLFNQIVKLGKVSGYYKGILDGALGNYLKTNFKVGAQGKLVVGRNSFSGLYHQTAALLFELGGYGVKICDEGICSRQEFSDFKPVDRISKDTIDYVDFKISNLTFRSY